MRGHQRHDARSKAPRCVEFRVRRENATTRRVVAFSLWWRERDSNPRPPGYEPDELPDCSTSRTDNRSSCHRVPQPRLVSCSTNVPYRVGTIGFITPFMSGAADLVPYEPSRWFPQNRSSHLVLPVAPVQWCVSAYGTASPSHVFDGHPVQGGFLVRSATESDASLNANRMP